MFILIWIEIFRDHRWVTKVDIQVAYLTAILQGISKAWIGIASSQQFYF